MINEDPSTLIAAGIIHETIHFWQMESGSSVFLKYLEPGKWKRINHQQRELEAIRHEIQVLKLVGANRAEIYALEKERGTHWQAPSFYSRSARLKEGDLECSQDFLSGPT